MANSCFLFQLDQHLSAIDAVHVEEVFAVPELTLIPDAPLGIVGVVDLRGKILPVLHLQINAVNSPHQHRLTDSVLVLRYGQIKVGLLVNNIRGIRDISPHTLNHDLSSYPYELAPDAHRMFTGLATDEETILMLGDLENWLNVASIQQVISVTSFLINRSYDDSSEAMLSASFSLEDQQVLRQRSESLRQSQDEDGALEETQTVVAIVIGGQLFGIDSQLVREFITVCQAIPIPCCPPHIVGGLNVRGDVMPVVDLRNPLGLTAEVDVPRTPKAIVIELEDDDMIAVVLVEDIRDAMVSVDSDQVNTAFDTTLAMGNRYLQGTTTYEGQTMQILNLPKLLMSDAIAVNEVL